MNYRRIMKWTKRSLTKCSPRKSHIPLLAEEMDTPSSEFNPGVEPSLCVTSLGHSSPCSWELSFTQYTPKSRLMQRTAFKAVLRVEQHSVQTLLAGKMKKQKQPLGRTHRCRTCDKIVKLRVGIFSSLVTDHHSLEINLSQTDHHSTKMSRGSLVL